MTKSDAKRFLASLSFGVILMIFIFTVAFIITTLDWLYYLKAIVGYSLIVLVFTGGSVLIYFLIQSIYVCCRKDD